MADSLCAARVHMPCGGNLDFLCVTFAGNKSPQLQQRLQQARAQQLRGGYEQQFNVVNVVDNSSRNMKHQNFRTPSYLEDPWDGRCVHTVD